MSARRVSAQNPSSSIGNKDGSGGCQVIPSPARSCANVLSRIAKGWLQNACDVMSIELYSRACGGDAVTSSA
jgi:hypothetical protein